jgi:hypothetical protein
LARVAEIMFKGGITPPGMTNPHTLAAVILAGLEVGLCPTQAVGSIMLTNGRLSIYGDAALALVRASGLLVSISEEVSGEGDARRCVCKVTRKGETERAFSFSMGEARQAGLIERAKGKDGKGGGPWVTYPDRMLTFRSRGYALRDVFPDVLRGLAMQEVEADEVPATRVVQATQATAAEVVTESGEVKQLGTAAVTEPAAATGQSVATAPATQQEPPADPNGPVGVDQLSEIKFIKERWATAIGAVEPEQQAAKWSELLGTYHVKSAREFTRATAATFIEVEGKKYDPFGHPSTASQT